MAAKQNQAGPSSAPPETQEGLKETQQQPQQITKGANQDDQLVELKENAENTAANNKADEN